jgi:hypothetical protein
MDLAFLRNIGRFCEEQWLGSYGVRRVSGCDDEAIIHLFESTFTVSTMAALSTQPSGRYCAICSQKLTLLGGFAEFTGPHSLMLVIGRCLGVLHSVAGQTSFADVFAETRS